MARRSSFKYHRRDASEVDKRASQQAGNREGIVGPDYAMFTPAEGDNLLRIMPPTFADSAHYGMDVWVHYGIGPDQSAFLCPNKMLGEPCPICEERQRAEASGDSDYAKDLSPGRRVLMWVIDRDKESEGVKVWSASWTLDRDIAKLSKNKRTGEIYYIDDPDDGYDVEFERTGKGKKTKYVGMAISRHSSDLGPDADEWLDYIEDHPLDTILIEHDYDFIKKVFSGGSRRSSRRERGDSDDDKKRDEDEAPRSLSRGLEKKKELDWEGVHALTFDEMDQLAERKELDAFATDYETDQEFAKAICELLQIDKPRSRSRTRTDDDDRGRGRSRTNDDEEPGRGASRGGRDRNRGRGRDDNDNDDRESSRKGRRRVRDIQED